MPRYTGTNANDTLLGSAESDLLEGLAGDDSLQGGKGADTLVGGPGRDILTGGQGQDTFVFRTLEELKGFDTIVDFEPGDRIDISAVPGVRFVLGDSLPPGLSGSASSPILLLRTTGFIEIYDRPGAGWTGYFHAGPYPLEERVPGSRILEVVPSQFLTGTTAGETLSGDRGSDELIGLQGADLLQGGEGRDTLRGGTGIDTLVGGLGHDRLYGGDGGDLFVYNTFEDLRSGDTFDDLHVGDRIDLTRLTTLRIFSAESLPEGVVPSVSDPVLLLKANGLHPIYAGFFNNSPIGYGTLVTRGVLLRETFAGSRILEPIPPVRLQGGATADRQLGGVTDDDLSGGAGDDTLIGGPGRDTLAGGPGADTYVYQSIQELMTGDAFSGFDDNDRIDLSAVPGLRVIFSGSTSTAVPAAAAAPTAASPVIVVSTRGMFQAYGGSDTFSRLSFPTSGEFVETAPGSRILVLAPAVNRTGSTGEDNLTGTARGDTLDGGAGDDNLDGAGGNDLLRGSVGSDVLQGGAGDDVLNPGDDSDYDQLYGEAGFDRFVISAINRNDSNYIGGFTAEDLIDLTSLSGLRVIRGGALPSGLVPTPTAPIGLIMDTGDIRLYVGAAEYATISVWGYQRGHWMAIEVRETTPGSRVLQMIEAAAIDGTGDGDSLPGSAGPDVIRGLAGADLLFGGAGIDKLMGGYGDDTLVGGGGADALDGGPGQDTYRYDSLADIQASDSLQVEPGDFIDLSRIQGLQIVFGNTFPAGVTPTAAAPLALINPTGAINFYGASFAYLGSIFTGGSRLIETVPGSRILTAQVDSSGTAGDDGLIGRQGFRAETLSGGLGADTLTAGPGTEFLFGGTGPDVFRFTSLSHLKSTVRVMDLGVDDVIDLSAIAGLQIAFGNELPVSAVPSSNRPWLLVKSNGFLDVFDGVRDTFISGQAMDVIAGPVIRGNLSLIETSPGSRILRPAPTGPGAVTTRWFDHEGVAMAASNGAPVRLVMVSEGYRSDQADLFYERAQEYISSLFSSGSGPYFDPLGRFGNLFEASALFIPSAQAGLSDPDRGAPVDNAFRATYQVNRGLMGMDEARVAAFVDANVVISSGTRLFPVVMINADFGRSNGAFGGRVMQVTPPDRSDVETLFHEFGHSIFEFADEYVEIGATDPAPPDVLFSTNVSRSPVVVPWQHWVGYEDVDWVIGSVQGGLYRETGIWRPVPESQMRADVAFSAPHKEVMVARLYELWGDYLEGFRLTSSGSISPRVREQDVLSFRWSLNGAATGQATPTFSVDALLTSSLSPLQRHQLTLSAVDGTGLIRLPTILDTTRQSESIDAMWGTASANLMTGTALAELLHGADGNDDLQGLLGDDLLFGGRGDDLLRGSEGNDALDGGEGNDVAIYATASTGYRIVTDSRSGMTTVTDLSGREGVDSLMNVESLRFSDQTVVILSAPAVNLAPTSVNGTSAATEDTVLSGALPAASDGNGDAITYAKVTNPASGVVAVSANGSYTYTPNANFNGTDAFNFSVSDGRGGTNTYTQTITVTAVNDAPTGAVSVSGVAQEGQGLVVSHTLGDVDGLGAVTYQWRAAGVAIQGATGASYTPVAADVGKAITVVASYTDGGGTRESVISAATVAVAAAAVATAPVSSSTALSFLQAGGAYTVANSGVRVFGGAGVEQVSLMAGAGSVVLDQAVERVALSGAASAFRYSQQGNQLVVHDALGTTPLLSVPLQRDEDGTVIVFTNGQASAKLLTGGVMQLGGATVAPGAPQVVSPTLGALSLFAPAATAQALVFLQHNDPLTVVDAGVRVFGHSGSETVTLGAAASAVVLDQSVEAVKLPLAASSYRFLQLGNQLAVYDITGATTLVTVPLQRDADGTVFQFASAPPVSALLLSGGVMQLGGQVVSRTAPTALNLGGPQSVSVTVNAMGSVTDSPEVQTTYMVQMGPTYVYTIAGFSAGDRIMGPAGVAATVINNSFTDGAVTLQYAQGTNIVSITLTGLSTNQDGSLFAPSDFSGVFGAGTLG